MSDHPTYTADAAALDVAIDIRIAEIRAALDRGEVTLREAADQRVAAYEDHLEQVRELRAHYFGGDR